MVSDLDDIDQYKYLYLGTVADREDPEALGRVRVLVPGIYEEPSPWALPLGTLGGGSAQRGGYFVPEKGADVGVWFVMGDPQRPVYIAGHWGKPGGETEAPSFLEGLSKAAAPKVRGIETKEFVIVFDDRDGDEKLLIKSKTNGVQLRVSKGKIEGGAEGALEPLVFGNRAKQKLEEILDGIMALTVPTGMGPSGTPINTATFAAIKSALGEILIEGL